MKPFGHPIWLLSLALAAVFFSGPAFAQDGSPANPITDLSRIVRWSGVIVSVLWIAGALIFLRVSKGFVESFGGDFSASRLTVQKIYTIVQFIVYITSTVAVILLSFRIDETTMAVIGGSLAVAVGFAMKDLVASYIAGLIIMLDRPFNVGDRVKFAGEYGDVIEVGLRSVRMRTLDDSIVTIPNSKFLTDITVSGNAGELDMQVVIDFVIATDQDAETARTIITEAALSSRYIYLAKPLTVLINQWYNERAFGIRLRLKAYVLDTRYEKEFESDISTRVIQEFQARGIRFDCNARPQTALSTVG